MRLRSILFLAVIFAIISTSVAEARHRFAITSIENYDGLSSNYVKAVCQDSFGFMWFGTKNGLNSYDGVNVRKYNCYDNELSRGNNNVSALYQRNDTLWVGTDRGVYTYDMRREIFKFLDLKTNDGIGAVDWVSTILSDSKGAIWILVPNQGVFRLKDGNLKYYSITNHGGDKNKLPLCVNLVDNEIFVGTSHQGLYKYEEETDRFRQVGNSDARAKFNNMTMSYIVPLGDQLVLLSDNAGHIITYNTLTGDTRPVPFSKTGKAYIRAILKVGNQLWIGEHNGLEILDLTDGSETLLDSDTMGKSGLSDNTIGALCLDRDGNVWVGTFFGGVNFVQRKGLVIEHFTEGKSQRSLSGRLVRGICSTPNGRLWIGHENGGYDTFDPVSGLIQKCNQESSSQMGVLNVKSKGDKVFVGQVRNGLTMIDTSTGSSQVLCKNLMGDDTSVYAVLEDSKGNLWVGLDWGLFVRQAGSEEFEQVEDVGFDWISDIFESKDGTIWFASMGNGVWTLAPGTKNYKHYAFDENYSNGLRSNSVSAISQDSKGNIWLSTDRGGLSRFDKANDNFVTYSVEEGLPDNVVYNVLEDKSGYLWFGTNNGLVKFNPATGSVKHFVSHRGGLLSSFGYHAAARDNDDMFYFGGIDGIISFDPMMDVPMDSLPPLYLTHMRVGNDDVTPSVEGSPLKENLIYVTTIDVPNSSSSVRFSVATPNYGIGKAVKFSYRLLPNDEEWIEIQDPGDLYFAGLSAGKYTLELRSACGELSSIRPYTLNVLPAWYESWWAYLIYTLLFVVAISTAWRYYRYRQDKEMVEKANMLSIKKEKELYINKIQFFTEIAHEIRTPLSLIRSPLEAIDEIGVEDERVSRYLKTIRMNTMRLLDLTNHLLDFQKIDRDQHNLTFGVVDVTAMIQEIMSRFELTMSLKSKEVNVTLPEKSVYAAIDKEAVTKIVSNLFNNALKYSDSRIDVNMSVNDNVFTLSVASDGVKIEGEDRLKIFEPFYQLEAKGHEGGVGIGLPLASTLAKLHNGSLHLADDSILVNTFVLEIPLRQEGIEPEPEASPTMAEYVMEEEPTVANGNIGHSVLLAEDNDEMRAFLCEQLSKSFEVESASNGKEALEILGERKFDIVITDVMMPEMDGYELCSKIKENLEISNIPVVFITAKNDLASKVKALKCGGEAYIEKPFSLKYLQQQLMSILDNRMHERKAFMKQPFFTVDNMKLNKADEEFMNKVVSIITENISDENFSVESMAESLCMSRSSLLRRIKTLFNLSPVELIRLIKLKKAAELIQEGKYRIGDVCFMVGINSSSYFSKLFFKQFGVTPKVFEKQCQKKSKSSAGEFITE